MTKIILWGLLARILSFFIPVKQKHWVFGSDFGKSYREGSKYLLEYIMLHHQDYTCFFVTKNKELICELENKGIPVVYNFSIRGILTICKADCIFTTQSISDIFYGFRKKNRKHYYLVHGQPFKYAAEMLPQSYRQELRTKSYLWIPQNVLDFVKKTRHYLTIGYVMQEVSFLSATSEFTAQYLQLEHRSNAIKILGMPRNDALFDDKRMRNEKWDSSFDGKFIITYMPTHRKYGRGDLSQTPFLNRDDVQEWMRENNVLLLVKQHPNMVHKMSKVDQTDVIKNISKSGYDPQVVIYHSDVLITDYSSVWMDYLLLRRPLIFYFYDNFEEDDAGCYYNLRDEFPENYCESEDGLFKMLQKALVDSNSLKPSEKEVLKFHKYIDNNSCKRYFKEISKEMYGEG
nr:CDP-glycerol glycerophosphotransferase family protein [uncultured Prevotella sp.]